MVELIKIKSKVKDCFFGHRLRLRNTFANDTPLTAFSAGGLIKSSHCVYISRFWYEAGSVCLCVREWDRERERERRIIVYLLFAVTRWCSKPDQYPIRPAFLTYPEFPLAVGAQHPGDVEKQTRWEQLCAYEQNIYQLQGLAARDQKLSRFIKVHYFRFLLLRSALLRLHECFHLLESSAGE